MNPLTLILRSLRFHWRAHLGVLFGAAVSTTVLIGALAAGDSVRYSLDRLVLKRLGRVESAMTTGEWFFRSRLADDLCAALRAEVAPGLQLRGAAVSVASAARANQVQFLGVDERFWAMSPGRCPVHLEGEKVMVNAALASKLGLRPGDEIVARIEKPGLLSRDVALSSSKGLSTALRLQVKAIASDDQFGRFSLKAEQAAPLHVYVSLSFLSRLIDQDDRANMLLVAAPKAGAPLLVKELNEAMRQAWSPADAGIDIRMLKEQGVVELRSSRVFLEPTIAGAAFKVDSEAQGVFTYLVNSVTHGDKMTPYSFVSASGAPLIATNLAVDEIVVNEWLADDLGLKPDDTVELSYYVIGAGRALEERTASFKVRFVVPIRGPAADKDLMPLLPGLSDAGHCRDWDAGIPIDLNRVRSKDEEYWNQYGGTPKAFVTLPAAQKMWLNRFGSLTAVRYPGRTVDGVSNAVQQALEPAALGFVFQPVLEAGLKAAGQSVDFGQLFIGLSGFIMAAALILMGLLFAFGVERRAEETGTLLALGFTPWKVRRLFLAEGFVLAVVGAVLGTAGGVLYNRAILRALGTVWRGAVGVLPLEPHVDPGTLAAGCSAGVAVAVLAMLLVLRRQAGRTIRDLQNRVDPARTSSAVRRRIGAFLAVVCLAAALAMAVVTGPGRGKEAAGVFLGAGALMLVGSLSAVYAVLLAMAGPGGVRRVRGVVVGLRNAARQRGRSLAVIGLLACGVFVVFAVGANRQGTGTDPGRRDSGTGGFAFMGETAIPIVHDLNSDRDRSQLGLDGPEMAGVRFVQIRVRDGDDASCLNLNRAQNVRFLGVNPAGFDERRAFLFSHMDRAMDPVHPWLVLNTAGSAVADQTVITWGLGKSVGDTQPYEDDRGTLKSVKLVAGLAGSVFQGSLLISEDQFCADFPSLAGYRMLLVDAPPGGEAAVARTLRRALEDYGLDLAPAAQRLAEFGVVENAYLSIFLALGGLGLILGSAGIGVVVIRNVQDRRRELAILRALGFSRRSVQWVVLSEHLFLVMAGLLSGVVSAIVAILPALAEPTVAVPRALIVGLVVLLFVGGAGWAWLATALATKGDLLPALRHE